jgi:protein-tyrosine-phosphatase
MQKIKVLFVCLGNICRSPLAEAIFKDKLKKKGLERFFEVDSCGTSNYHIGDQPDSRTIANARKNGIAIDHCGRQFTANDFGDFDYILAMDKRITPIPKRLCSCVTSILWVKAKKFPIHTMAEKNIFRKYLKFLTARRRIFWATFRRLF